MSSDSGIHIDLKEFTPGSLTLCKTLVADPGARVYLRPHAPLAELLELAVSDPTRCVALTWSISNSLMGISGMVIDRDDSEVELWCVAADVPEHWWIVSLAAKTMLKRAFQDLKLEAARTRCNRSDTLAVKALLDAGMLEEGTQQSHTGTRDAILFGVLRRDWEPDPEKRKGGLVVRCRWEDRYPLYSALIIQCAFLTLIAYLSYVASGWFGLFLSLILNAAMLFGDLQLLRHVRNEGLLGPGLIGPAWFASLGITVLGLLGVIYRVRWSAEFSSSWVFVALLSIGSIALQANAFKKMWRGRVPWLWLGSLIVFMPVLWVWLPLSSSAEQFTSISATTNGAANWRDKAADRARVIAERRSWSSSSQPRVAVALSGGGYRAALIHAGVLEALDRQRLPVHYLTTVSGGSIIGAQYALGYRPQEFIRATYGQRPGLGLEKLSLGRVVGSLLLPWVSDADVYADHFARFFFGAATLHDLPETPVLIVNATDIEASPENAREVFTRELAERSGGLAQSTRVADVVAASGSFPVAFDPKTIRWFAAGKDLPNAPIVRRRFVDGGVLENIGLDGLVRYLRIRHALHLPLDKPSVLIVSDASMPDTVSPLATKPELTDLLSRVQDISYSAYQRELLRRFTGRGDYAEWMRATHFDSQIATIPYASLDAAFENEEPRMLKVILLPATTAGLHRSLERVPLGQCSFHGRTVASVQAEVARFGTLEELSPADVEKAAWLGSSLVHLYGGAVRCAVSDSKSCVTPPPSACPALQF